MYGKRFSGYLKETPTCVSETVFQSAVGSGVETEVGEAEIIGDGVGLRV